MRGPAGNDKSTPGIIQSERKGKGRLIETQSPVCGLNAEWAGHGACRPGGGSRRRLECKMPARRVFERAPSHISTRHSGARVMATTGIIIMQQAFSIEQTQTQPSRNGSIIVAGVGGALVASAVTLVLLMNSGSAPAAVADGASSGTNQCQMLQRKLLVSTTSSGGTVRLREGNYLSPKIKLGAEPQAVVFPLPRPETTPVEEVLTIEGDANDVVITSDVTALRRVLDHVIGVTAFNVMWKPMKSC
jgi:hypothetical protein